MTTSFPRLPVRERQDSGAASEDTRGHVCVKFPFVTAWYGYALLALATQR